jgi:predicted O-methyltransferase YrrM
MQVYSTTQIRKNDGAGGIKLLAFNKTKLFHLLITDNLIKVSMNLKQHEVVAKALSADTASYLQSVLFVDDIAKQIPTFHHHFHIVWPLLESVNGNTYVEIGCYAGASMLTALQWPALEKAIAIDTFSVLPNHVEQVKSNLAQFAPANSIAKVELTQGSSHSFAVIISVYRSILGDINCNGIDVLFIDGDHSYNGVQDDFRFFHPLVRHKGIVVFDDYADSQSSPQVKPAVDNIAKSDKTFQVIGQVHNDAGAFGNGLPVNGLSNEFLLQKACDIIGLTRAKYIICIATYYRSNKSTEASLKRLFASIVEQTITDWFVIVIGDRYENATEFDALSEILPRDKSLFINLPIACERDDAAFDGRIWFVAGCGAMNYALMLCQNAQHDCIYVHVDDDDVWESNHLESLDLAYSNYSEAQFVWTMGRHFNNQILPRAYSEICRDDDQANLIVECFPAWQQTLHSSVSWRAKSLKLRYNHNAYKNSMPADGDMWQRATEFMRMQNMKSFLVRRVTVIHDSECQ